MGKIERHRHGESDEKKKGRAIPLTVVFLGFLVADFGVCIAQHFVVIAPYGISITPVIALRFTVSVARTIVATPSVTIVTVTNVAIINGFTDYSVFNFVAKAVHDFVERLSNSLLPSVERS